MNVATGSKAALSTDLQAVAYPRLRRVADHTDARAD